MKQQKNKSLLFYLLLSALFIYSCDKENLGNKMFGGDATWSGVIMFKNQLTSITDTAHGVSIQITKTNINSSDSIYKTYTENGLFSIPYLTSGHYQVKLNYQQVTSDSLILGYSYKGSFDLKSNSIVFENIVMNVDSLQSPFALKLFGKATYLNLATSQIDDAAGAIINIFHLGVSSNNPLKTTIADLEGNYEFINLPKGHYRIESRVTTTNNLANPFDLIYKNTATFQLKSLQTFKEDVLLKWDSLHANEYYLKLFIIDSTNHALPNADVCLFSTLNYLTANAPGCNGSLRSDQTNNNGIVIFNNLQAKTYYINARDTLGVIALSNQSTTNSTKTALKLHSSNSRTIALKEQ